MRPDGYDKHGQMLITVLENMYLITGHRNQKDILSSI